jgi:hypothetical protein
MTKPLFERRHYSTLAELIRTAPLNDLEREPLATHFAAGLAKDNPRFIPEQFLKACGVEE